MLALAASLIVLAQGKQPLILEGSFLEACSCATTCAFETRGVLPPCHSLGAYRIEKGSYAGGDVSGCGFGWVTSPQGACFVYIDAPTKQGDSVKRLAMTLFAEGFGKIQGATACRIEIEKSEDEWRLSFDDGKIASLAVKPVLGGDGKTPVELRNVFGEPYDSLYQATVTKGQVSVPGHEFTLSDTSAFYQPRIRVRKQL